MASSSSNKKKRVASDEDGASYASTTNLLRLHEALLRGWLVDSQGTSGRVFRYDPGGTGVLGFLQGKLKKSTSHSHSGSFDYLLHQGFDTPDVNIIQRHIETLVERHGECSSNSEGSSSHAQTRVPCSNIQVGAADARAGKKCGLLAVPTYSLAQIVNACVTDGDLAEGLLTYDANPGGEKRTRVVGAHRCKRKTCNAVGHNIAVCDAVNKQHDYCPSYWVIRGALINRCVCGADESERCIRPGESYNLGRDRVVLESVIGAYVNKN